MNLIILSEIGTEMKIKYLIGDFDYYSDDTILFDGEDDDFGKEFDEDSETFNRFVTKFNLKEIKLEDVKNYEFDEVIDVGIFLEDGKSDEETIFKIDQSVIKKMIEDFEDSVSIEPDGNKIFMSDKKDSDKIYLVPIGMSMDGEYHLAYIPFYSKEKALKVLEIFENGECGKYLFYSWDYYNFVEDFSHGKINMDNGYNQDCFVEFLQSHSNIEVLQPIFAGFD